jgi:hypothetical protein
MTSATALTRSPARDPSTAKQITHFSDQNCEKHQFSLADAEIAFVTPLIVRSAKTGEILHLMCFCLVSYEVEHQLPPGHGWVAALASIFPLARYLTVY